MGTYRDAVVQVETEQPIIYCRDGVNLPYHKFKVMAKTILRNNKEKKTTPALKERVKESISKR